MKRKGAVVGDLVSIISDIYPKTVPAGSVAIVVDVIPFEKTTSRTSETIVVMYNNHRRPFFSKEVEIIGRLGDPGDGVSS